MVEQTSNCPSCGSRIEPPAQGNLLQCGECREGLVALPGGRMVSLTEWILSGDTALQILCETLDAKPNGGGQPIPMK